MSPLNLAFLYADIWQRGGGGGPVTSPSAWATFTCQLADHVCLPVLAVDGSACCPETRGYVTGMAARDTPGQ